MTTALALAHASHELRGAMTAAELCVASLERRPESEADLRSWADDLRVQLERATWAIEDLDRLRGSGAVPPVDEPVEVGRLLSRRTRAWARLARSSAKTLRLEWRAGQCSVSGDARRLCQALDNLISNAIGHGGDEIVVSASRAGSRLRLIVADGGRGITKHEDACASSSSRHGHGLTIARSGVEACGGSMRATPDGVVVDLPLFEHAGAALSAA